MNYPLLCLITDCKFVQLFQGMWLIQLFISAFFAILFLQSGMDKVIDWKGNLEWLTGHFSKSILAGTVPLLLGVLTLVELSAGVVSAFAIVEVVRYQTYCMAFAGTALCAIAFIMLFFGQRIAKDYPGAASIAPYFLLAVVDLFFLS